jgi:hypothetical protein
MFQAYQSVKVVDAKLERDGEAGVVLSCDGSSMKSIVVVKMDSDQEHIEYEFGQLQAL